MVRFFSVMKSATMLQWRTRVSNCPGSQIRLSISLYISHEIKYGILTSCWLPTGFGHLFMAEDYGWKMHIFFTLNRFVFVNSNLKWKICRGTSFYTCHGFHIIWNMVPVLVESLGFVKKKTTKKHQSAICPTNARSSDENWKLYKKGATEGNANSIMQMNFYQ